MYEFEFDEEKSKFNLEKHRINFLEAQKLWKDSDFVEIKAKTTDEVRSMVIGKIDAQCWSAITTVRDKKIRIISVRHARKSEVRIYES